MTLLFTLALALIVAQIAYATHVPKPGPRLAKEIRKYWKTPAEFHMASCVFWYESRYREKVISETGDYGVAQVNRYTWERVFGSAFRDGRILTYRFNVQAAFRIYLAAGRSWSPWVAARYC